MNTDRLRACLARVIEAQRVDYSKDPVAGREYDAAAEDVIDAISDLDVHTGNFHIALRDLIDDHAAAIAQRDRRIAELTKALERERNVAIRSDFEARRQMRGDWARHFDRMVQRIDAALRGGEET